MTNKVLYLAIAVIVGVAIGFIAGRRVENVAVSQPTLSTQGSSVSNPRVLATDGTNVEQDGIDETEIAIAAKKQLVNGPDALAVKDDRNDENYVLELKKRARSKLENLFQTEEVDVNWAQDHQKEVMQAFQEFSADNPDLILNFVECKSTICRLELFSYNEHGWVDYKMMEKLVDYFPWGGELATIVSENGSTVMMYITVKEQASSKDVVR